MSGFYGSSGEISICAACHLSKLLCTASRGRFGLEKAEEIIKITKNFIEKYSSADTLALSLTLEEIEFYSLQIQRIECEIHLIFLQRPSPVLSIPGIGEVIGAIIVSEIGNINRFSNPNKLLAFTGLEPSIYESGKFAASSGSMVKRGSPYLRWALIIAARLVPRYSSTFVAYFEKKSAESQHFNIATSHVAKKLVRVIFHLKKQFCFYRIT